MFGYKRIHDLLRSEFPGVNHKHVYRSTRMPTWRCAAASKLSVHQTIVCRFKLHAMSMMFGAWILSLAVCLTAEESNASLWPMTSATSELTLKWTLESPANMSQDLWIMLPYLEAIQMQFAQKTGQNLQVAPSWLGPLCMAFATF